MGVKDGLTGGATGVHLQDKALGLEVGAPDGRGDLFGGIGHRVHGLGRDGQKILGMPPRDHEHVTRVARAEAEERYDLVVAVDDAFLLPAAHDDLAEHARRWLLGQREAKQGQE